MALLIKQAVRTNLLGNEVWVTDKTSQYVIATNPGGWGAPNPELNQTALIFYSLHITPDGTNVLTPLTSQLTYSNTDTNLINRSVGFAYDGDGHYSSYIFAIKATVNGTTFLDTDTIVVGDYYYLVGDAVYLKTNTTPTKITDYGLLVDVDTINKAQCDKMFYNKLAIKKNDEYYREYRDARDGNDPELARDLLTKIDDLDADIAGADYRFRVGLFTIAENIVAELLEKHGIV